MANWHWTKSKIFFIQVFPYRTINSLEYLATFRSEYRSRMLHRFVAYFARLRVDIQASTWDQKPPRIWSSQLQATLQAASCSATITIGSAVDEDKSKSDDEDEATTDNISTTIYSGIPSRAVHNVYDGLAMRANSLHLCIQQSELVADTLVHILHLSSSSKS